MYQFSHQEGRRDLTFKAEIAENMRIDRTANCTDLVLDPIQKGEVRRDGWMEQFQRYRGRLPTGGPLVLGHLKAAADPFANFGCNPVALRQDRANTDLPIAVGLARTNPFPSPLTLWRRSRPGVP